MSSRSINVVGVNESPPAATLAVTVTISGCPVEASCRWVTGAAPETTVKDTVLVAKPLRLTPNR